MPGGDGTGPMGLGPRTGRGLGPCGRGLGFRRGLGRGSWSRLPTAITKEEEKHSLEAQLKALEAEKERIQGRLNELNEN